MKRIAFVIVSLALLLAFPLSALCYSGTDNSAEGAENLDTGRGISEATAQDGEPYATEVNAEGATAPEAAAPTEAQGGKTAESAPIAESGTQSGGTGESAPIAENGTQGGGTGESGEAATDATDEGTTDDTGAANPFDALYRFFEEHIGEVFSVLAFIGSLIIMLVYKRGFLPLVERGIGTLCGKVGELKDAASSVDGSANALSERAARAIECSEGALVKINEALAAVEERLEGAEESRSLAESFRTVLSMQTDMLYEIFMAASLPQYLKDKVGEKVSVMKKQLDVNEAGDGNNAED